MLRSITIIIVWLASTQTSAQTNPQPIYRQYVRAIGELRYGKEPDKVFPYGNRGYTLILPPAGHPVAGTIAILDDQQVDLDDTTRDANIRIDKEAGPEGLAVLYISTGIPVDLYFSPASLEFVDSTMRKVFDRFHLPGKNIFMLGAMVSGHRALKYIEYIKTGHSVFKPHIAGVILSESAIDWVRQWYECQKQIRDNTTAVQNFEGHFIGYLLQENLHTTPAANIDAYIDFSSYSYFDTSMKKRVLFDDLAIRAYTFADTRYWFSAPGKGVYDSNYPDMSGFINEQKLAGNKKAELMVFHTNPDDPPKTEMRRQSSTWSLVDKKELIDWVMRQITNN
jgi:hypothetical protein